MRDFLDLNNTRLREEILSGFAEIIKHGAIADKELFAFLETNRESALALDSEVIEKLVYDSVTIKSEIVNQDEKEKGERRKLNFGHTFGHAIEKLTNVRHGEAVSAGMVLAAELSVKKNKLSPEASNRLMALIDNYGLPVRLNFDSDAVLKTLRMDKKREGDQVFFVFLNDIGDACIEQIDFRELETLVGV